MTKYWITFPDGVLYSLDSKDNKFKIIYPNGDVKSAWLFKYLPNRYKLKLMAITDQKIKMVVKRGGKVYREGEKISLPFIPYNKNSGQSWSYYELLLFSGLGRGKHRETLRIYGMLKLASPLPKTDFRPIPPRLPVILSSADSLLLT